MTDYELTGEQQQLRTMVRDFARSEIAPAAARIDAAAEYPEDEIMKMARQGLFGLFIPEKYGGADRGLLDLCLAVEELAGASAAVDNYLRISLSLAIVPVMQHGTEEQKKRYLPPHAAGERLACFALTEPEAGSDPASMQMQADRRDNGYVLNGVKRFITNGDRAGTVVVFAMTDTALRQRGITAFVLDRETPGLSTGRRETTMGMRGLSVIELVFDNCLVPETARLGEEGQGLKIALEALDVSRVTVGAESVGIAQAAYEAAVSYAKERRQFGQPVAGFQSIQWLLADMATRIDAARLLTYRAARLHDSGKPFLKEAAMAKLYAAETAVFVADGALRVHGGSGYTADFPVERYLRDAYVTGIYEGTADIMRMTIARSLLRDV